MCLHPLQPIGGEEPLGDSFVLKSTFAEAFTLFNRYSQQKEEIQAMMDSYQPGPDRDALREMLEDHLKLIAEILECIEITASTGA